MTARSAVVPSAVIAMLDMVMVSPTGTVGPVKKHVIARSDENTKKKRDISQIPYCLHLSYKEPPTYFLPVFLFESEESINQ